MYLCQYTSENVASPYLKPVLQYLPFFFVHFGGYLALIGRTVAKIGAKTLLRRLWNRFYSIHRFFLGTLVVILRQSDVPLLK